MLCAFFILERTYFEDRRPHLSFQSLHGADYLRARIYQGAMQNGFSSFTAGGGETYFEMRSESRKCIITDMYAFIHDHQYAYILELDGSLSAYSDGMKQESWFSQLES